MKKLSLLLASLFASAALSPLAAHAGHDRDGGYGGYEGYGYEEDGGGYHRSSRSRHDDRHHDCGRPVRMIKVCVGHDYHGCPIYRWVPAPVRHRGDGYSSGGHSRGYDHYERYERRSRSGIRIRIGG